jgi:hypothetical protein
MKKNQQARPTKRSLKEFLDILSVKEKKSNHFSIHNGTLISITMPAQ